MLKKLFITFLILVFGAGLIVYFYFEAAVRRSIEIAGSSALGTAVTVTGVSLSPLSGKGSIRGLTVANPDGFSAPYAFDLESLDIEIDMDTVFSNVIEINSIVIKEAHVTYETHLINDNIRTLLANIPSSAETPNDPSGASAGTRVIIRDFQMLGPQINLQALATAAPLLIPDLHLQNIGDQNNAVTVAQAARQILNALNTSLLSANVRNLDTIREGVQQQLKDEASKAEEKIEELSDGLRGLLNR